jgi:serine/threonine-protein kinase
MNLETGSLPGQPSRPAEPSQPVATPTPTTTGASSYRSLEVIAKGGMGTVELVTRQEGRFRRLYALKRLHEHLTEDAEFQGMFLDEARVAGLIDHPNVVSVLDVGRDERGPYLVMPYVHGISLARLVTLARRANDVVPIQVALRIGLDVAKGLHAAHDVIDADGTLLHLVHRDLSPQNVLVGFDGTARVTDFGIAKALGQSTRTSTGVAKGKHSYMSPEQLTFRAVDRRSDLFALGIVLYELLAGRRLYGGPGSDGPRAILEEPPPDIGEVRPDVPPAIVELLLELLSKSPDERPADAAIVAHRLESVLAELVARDGPTSVSSYLGQVAAEDRLLLDERQRRALTSATAAPSTGPVSAFVELPTENDAHKRRTRVAMVLAAAAVLGISLGLAWVSSSADVPTTSTPPPPALLVTTGPSDAGAPADATVVSQPDAWAPPAEPDAGRRRLAVRADSPTSMATAVIPTTGVPHTGTGMTTSGMTTTGTGMSTTGTGMTITGMSTTGTGMTTTGERVGWE